MFGVMCSNLAIGDVYLLVPVLLPIIGAYVVFAIGKKNSKIRDIAALITVLSELLYVSFIFVKSLSEAEGGLQCFVPSLCGLGLCFNVDGFRAVYMMLAALMWAATMTVSEEYFDHGSNKNRYYLFVILTLGMTMGVFMSADLYTTFVFFELMSFVSYVTVAQEENPDAVAGGKLYLGIAVFGGMMMLLGLMILINTVGTVYVDELYDAVANVSDRGALYAAGILISLGFAAKAGAFPLHIWLPKAHAVAPAPASAILSGILTKTGIYGILIISVRVFYKCEGWYLALLVIGVITMFTGALLALFSVNIKRTLACSSVSQIGFILMGLAVYGYSCLADFAEGFEHSALLSGRGTIMFMINHTLVKMLLFLVAGMIYHNMHSLDLNVLRGFGRKKPLLKAQFIVGAASLMGIPGTCGFIGKSFVHEGLVHFTEIYEEALIAANEQMIPPALFIASPMFFTVCEKLFLIGSGMTAAYLIKLYVAIFVEKNADNSVQKKMDENTKYMSLKSEIALCVAMLVIPVIGLLPHKVLTSLANLTGRFINLPDNMPALPIFAWENIKGILICALIGVVIYYVVIRKLFMKDNRYINAWPSFLDLEKYLYMPLIKAVCFVGRVVFRALDSITDAIVVWLRCYVYNDEMYEIDIVEGTAVTKSLGKILNARQARKNRKILKKAEEGEIEIEDVNIAHRDYVHELALKYIWNRESRLVIFRTLSFGLSLFCIGFLLTMIYLLLK